MIWAHRPYITAHRIRRMLAMVYYHNIYLKFWNSISSFCVQQSDSFVSRYDCKQITVKSVLLILIMYNTSNHHHCKRSKAIQQAGLRFSSQLPFTFHLVVLLCSSFFSPTSFSLYRSLVYARLKNLTTHRECQVALCIYNHLLAIALIW